MNGEKKSLEDNLPFGMNYTRRFVSSGGEERLYRPQPIGNSGSVELVDYMGGDGTVERVATFGHGREVFKERPEQKDFIKYLQTRGITEPFSSVQLKLSVQSPILAALSLVYEPGVSLNEYSGRYSIMLDTSLEPKKAFVEAHSDGRNTEEILRVLKEGREKTLANYRELIKLDMARELARAGLGTDNDTRYFWKIDLLTLSRFVKTNRRKFPSSHPTRDYIEAIAETAQAVAPNSWSALTKEGESDLSLTYPTDEEIVDSGLRASSFGEQKTKRVTVRSLEERLFVPTSFLDHGQFQVVDYMGDDESFAQAARTSYGQGTKTQSDNRALVKTLIREAHTSPIEMAELAFESISPMFIDPRQAARHRTLDKHGFMGENPLGSRFFVPEDSEFRYQDRLNRQGRGQEMSEEDLRKAKAIFISDKEEHLDTARRLKNLGASEEITRLAKGVGFYTPMWRTGDTHNLGGFLRLRLESHAQKEVRDLADQVRGAMEAHTPDALGAIMTYRVNGMTLSEKEIGVMIAQGMLREDLDLENPSTYKGAGLVTTDKETGKPKLGREGEDFKKKLERLRGKK